MNHGQLINAGTGQAQIVIGQEDISSGQVYDAVGRMVGRQIGFGGIISVEVSSYNERGMLLNVYQPVQLGQSQSNTALQDHRTYDANGRLLSTTTYFRLAETRETTTAGTNVNIGGWVKHKDSYTYNLDGQVTFQSSYGRLLEWKAAVTPNLVNETGASATVNPLTLLSTVKSIYVASYIPNQILGYDYKYLAHESGSGVKSTDATNYTHLYRMSYEGRDSYLETGVSGSSTNATFKASTTSSQYDAWGKRLAVREQTPLPSDMGTLDDRVRYFTYDGEGGILRRREGIINNDGFFAQTNMEESRDMLYAFANRQQVAKQSRAGKLDIASLQGMELSGGGNSQTTVQAGENLQAVAQRVYGNSSLWYVLAEANAIGNSEITAGTTLKVPDVGQNKNDATTFKPYDPSETVGNTSPNLPYMAEPKGCNMLAMAIMIVVALVVTVVTYGAAAPYFSSLFSFGATMATTTGITVAGAVAGGFVAGVAGSIASQVVGKALGVVEHFSLRQAVGSGIAGGLTAGIGVAFGGAEGLSGLIESGKWGKVAAAATLSATSGYVANKIAGVPDTHFSWKSIAVSAVTDFVTKALLGAKPSDAARDGVIQPSTNEGFVGRVATEFGRAMVSRMVRSAAEVVLTGKSVGDNDIGLLLADAFGNALGQAIVGTMEAHKQRKETLGSFTADQTVKYNELVQSGVPKNDAIAYATQAAGPLPDYLLRQQDESSDDAWDYGYDEQNSAESDSEASTGVDVTNGLLGVAIGAGDDAVYVRNAGPNSARAGGNNTAERIATLEAIQVTGQKPAEYLIEQGQEWGRFNFSTDRDTSKFNYAGYILQNEPTTSTGAMIDLNNSARGLSASDISMVSEGYGILSGRMPNKIFDINNPKHFLIEVNLDGTSNHDKKNFDTNVKNLEVLTRDHDRIRTRYIRGVQTNLSEDISLGARAFDLLEGATGFDLRNRVDQAVSFINDQTNKIRGEMPDAVISVVYVGFSRGGLAAREAAYQVDKKGIAVNNSALVLFDSVGSMGLAGDRRDFNFHMAVNPRHQALQIMANDEHRDLFNVTSVYSGIQSFDRNKVEIKLPGAHTDIGGSYPNPYSRVSLSMAHSYMRALGVPMKSLGRQFAPLSPGDNRMALHDSNGFGMQLMSMIRHPQRTRFLGPRDPGAPREIYQSPRYDLPVRVTPRRIEPGELRPVIQYIPTGRRY